MVLLRKVEQNGKIKYKMKIINNTRNNIEYIFRSIDMDGKIIDGSYIVIDLLEKEGRIEKIVMGDESEVIINRRGSMVYRINPEMEKMEEYVGKNY
jgi:hypothetical protein